DRCRELSVPPAASGLADCGAADFRLGLKGRWFSSIRNLQSASPATLPLAAGGADLLRRGSRLRRLFLLLLRLRRLLLRGLARTHVWEQNHVAYGAAVGQKHRQAINADADAGRRGHAVG